MRKMKLFMLFAFGTLCAFPAFATGIPNDETNPSCDNSTLGTYSGSAALEPDWSANIIPIRWYNNNTLIQNPGANSTTCEYDGTLTTPTTAPSRTGYNFAGWKARPSMDFSELISLGNATGRWAITNSAHGNKICFYDNVTAAQYTQTNCASDEFLDLERNEWKISFLTGTLYGNSYCSAKAGDTHWTWSETDSQNWLTDYNELETTEGEKKYCWCQVTGWKYANNSALYAQQSITAASAWVLFYGFASDAGCRERCAANCAGGAMSSQQSFLRSLLTR